MSCLCRTWRRVCAAQSRQAAIAAAPGAPKAVGPSRPVLSASRTTGQPAPPIFYIVRHSQHRTLVCTYSMYTRGCSLPRCGANECSMPSSTQNQAVSEVNMLRTLFCKHKSTCK